MKLENVEKKRREEEQEIKKKKIKITLYPKICEITPFA